MNSIHQPMTLVWVLLYLWFPAGAVVAQPKDRDAILGAWQTEEKDGRIQIYFAGGHYHGKLTWGKELFEADGKTSRKDVNNPEAKLRTRPLQNLVILTGFTYRDGAWEDGTIYDPKNGKTYRCLMKLRGEKLEIRGYIGVSWLGRTVVWERVP